jgi:hypothetical protein
MRTRAQALDYPRGTIRLVFCQACAFIFNVAFRPDLLEYSQSYEETQGFSATFQAFHRRLAHRLVERHGLYKKDIIEIGCGKGEFLTMLCDLGGNRGLGLDPAYVPGRDGATQSGQTATFITDVYSEKYAGSPADFVCCKMTLEHIPRPVELVGTVRRVSATSPDTVVFFQVPDVTRILREVAFWDIYYEHCSYFSPGSLARLFRRCDFTVLDLQRDYDDQYVTIEARPGGTPDVSLSPLANDLDDLAPAVTRFREACGERIETWRGQLRAFANDGRRVVLWGAGSKAVAFLTTLGVRDELEYAVDVDPHKTGTFLAGTGHEIVAPSFLRQYRPDVVIIMNPIYRNEIEQALRAMSLSPTVLTV